MLRIKLVRSPIGHTAHNRSIVQALGLGKVNRVVLHEDTPSIRGMIHRVKHLIEVETTDEAKPKAQVKPSRAKAAAKAAPVAAPAEKPAAAAPKTPKPRKKAELAESKE